MNVFLNDKEITIFHGAKVLDVMRAYYAQHNKKLPCILPIVTDGYGNSVAPDGELSETIAIAEDGFSSAEEIGYLVTDAIRVASGSDIALINAGGVRLSTLPKGPLRTKDIYEVDPFGNEIVKFNLSGHEIRNLFITAFTFDDYKLLYPSGMTIRYLLNPDESLKDVGLLTTEGKPFDMNKTYSVVMNDYMASVYKYDLKDPGQGLFRPTAETTIDYLKKMKNIPSYRGMKRVEMVK